MSRSSARRGQVEPLAALAAVFALGAGLAVYAGALDARLPGTDTRPDAERTLDSVADEIEHNGVVRPGRLSAASGVAPLGTDWNASLSVGDRQWQVGPTAPETAGVADERVSVRTGPGRIRPGRLTVRVW